MFNYDDLEGIFARGFGGQAGSAGGRRFSMRGHDAQYQLTLDFLDAVNGTTRRVTLPDGRTLDVRIPPGVQDGQVIRLRDRACRASAMARPATRWWRYPWRRIRCSTARATISSSSCR